MNIEKSYIPRIADDQIKRYLENFGAVEVAGAKWCGKTWSSLKQAKSASYVDSELDLAIADPQMMLLGERPHLIDEWQEVPRIWDAVRRKVDEVACEPAQFILTGSATPLVSAGSVPVHSGAGRFGRVRMYPMSLFESGESNGSVSLQGLFENNFEPCKVESDTGKLVDIVCRGGWPAVISKRVKDGSLIANEYIEYVCTRSFPKISLETDVALRLMRSLAKNDGQSATYKTILSDMFGKKADNPSIMSEKTLGKYLSALTQMYLVDEINGWAPQSRSKHRFLTKPKRYFADPSLACAFLNLTPASLMKEWQTFGLFFENMVMRDLMVYSQGLPHFGDHPLHYYHDDSGLECDVIIELSDGRWAAIEIKVSESKVEEACKNLLRLKKKLCFNPKSQTSPPEFMAVIVGISEYARQREDGIYVVPIRALTK